MRLTALGSCPRPQCWGDWRILWLRPYGKADEVSADPRRLPPSVLDHPDVFLEEKRRVRAFGLSGTQGMTALFGRQALKQCFSHAPDACSAAPPSTPTLEALDPLPRQARQAARRPPRAPACETCHFRVGDAKSAVPGPTFRSSPKTLDGNLWRALRRLCLPCHWRRPPEPPGQRRITTCTTDT